MTRLSYALFLLVGVSVVCVMLIPGMEEQLSKIPGFVRMRKVFLVIFWLATKLCITCVLA